MENIDLEKVKKVHFIGIGGIGISAVARMLFQEGKSVTGNDLEDFDICKELKNEGIDIRVGTEENVIPKDADLLIYSRGWNTIGPEFLEYAKSLNIPMISYPESLKLISKDKYTIAVSGAHGKTTTTAMIGSVLLDAELEPTIIVGSTLKKIKSNFISGKSKYLVVEADEYRRSFHNLFPSILVITNIDADHLDYYKNIEDIKDAFRELASRVPSSGFIVCDPNSNNLKDVIANLSGKIIDYTKYLVSTSKISGAHNRNNAACALAVAEALGLSLAEAEKSLENFSGTWRRFEKKGKLKSGTLVYDDYAHHPTEVRAALALARESFPNKRIIVLFQPHLYSRTKNHLNDFAKAFAEGCDLSLIMPIYPAREPFDPSISSEMLVKGITDKGGKAQLTSNIEEVKGFSNFSPDDIFITMGAGDVYKIGEELLK